MRCLDSRSMVVQILIVFLIFSLFSLIGFTFYVVNQDKKATINNAEESLQTIASEKAQILSLVLKQTETYTENLAQWAEYFIDSQTGGALNPGYQKGQEGVLYRAKGAGEGKDGISSLFFPGSGLLDQETIDNINATEKLDPVFQHTMAQSKYIQWVYLATESGLLRIFPYSPIDMFGPAHMQRGDPFYVAANPENNPEGETVWTAPYLDFLGTGWMITCTHPIFKQNQMMGVVCADVKLSTLRDEFLADFRLGETGFAYLLEKNGDIIYHPEFEPEGGDKGQTYLVNIIDNDNVSPEYKRAVETILEGDEGSVTYQNPENGCDYTIAYAHIESRDWVLAVEINQRDYLAMRDLQKFNLGAFLIVVGAAIAFFAFFLHHQYSRPFASLIQNAKDISEGRFKEFDTIYNYTEIETLSTAFNKMSRDIKTYTEDLINKNNEIKSILSSIGGLFMILDADMEILMMNQKCMDVLGIKSFEGKKCYEAILSCDSMCSGCKFQNSIEKKSDCYARITIKDNIYENVYYPIINRENQVTEIIVHSRKITSKIMFEKELAQKEKMSEIGKLTSAVAHELKNPLTIIKGASYLTESYSRPYNNEQLNESIRSIIQTTENAEKIIYSLLDFSSPSQSEACKVDITKITGQVLLMLRRNCIQKNITIETRFSPDPCIYYGEAQPFKHIFLNLINNAIKAIGDEGKIIVSGEEIQGNSKYLRVSVKDNGTGIKASLRDKIFEPFFTTDDTEEGSGIGLWLTKIMVKKMEGSISLISEEGKGSEFIIMLPMKNEQE